MTVHPLPVTVISGPASAGKRALLDRLASDATGRRIAVIRTTDDTMRSELVAIAQSGNADAIVIDAPASAEPMSIAEALVFEDDAGPTLEAFVTLDTMVTVIDAATFLDELASAEGLDERGLVDGSDDRTVGEALIEQVEFCDVLVIIPAEETEQVASQASAIERLQSILSAINGRATQTMVRPADIAPEAVIGTGRFDFEATASAPGWLTALDPSAALSPEASRTAASNAATSSAAEVFVYRARRPFHPSRFFTLLHEAWPGVIRSKGLFWIASRNDMAGSLSQVGGTCRHGPAGFWWAAQPTEEWPEDDAFNAEIAHDWFASPDAQGRETVGDRRQELVMIGIDIDRDAWQRRFDACLLTDAEFALKKEDWEQFDDPFPRWDDDHEHEEDGMHDAEYRHDHERDDDKP